MNAPRELGPDFRSWMDDGPPMPADLPERTLRQTRHTRQRRRWLWFLPAREPTAGVLSGHDRRPPTVHMKTTPIGGLRMISPTKLIAAATVAALAGTLLLAGQPTTTRPAMPAAQAEPGVLTPVQGTMLVLAQSQAGETGTYTGGSAAIDEWWETEFRVDDPRLAGQSVSRHNRHIGAATSYAGGTRRITLRLENEGGSWVGSGVAYSDPSASGIHYQLLLEGQGGYEGLDAILALDNQVATAPFEVTGVIVSSGLPELPDPVPVD